MRKSRHRGLGLEQRDGGLTSEEMDLDNATRFRGHEQVIRVNQAPSMCRSTNPQHSSITAWQPGVIAKKNSKHSLSAYFVPGTLCVVTLLVLTTML